MNVLKTTYLAFFKIKILTKFKVYHNESFRVVLNFRNCLVLYSVLKEGWNGFTYLYCYRLYFDFVVRHSQRLGDFSV